jgi:uncharacterized membrane protein SpoIIM required for sporulation
MTQRYFVKTRQGFWDSVEEFVHGGKKKIRARSAWFPRAFRELTQDLNTARAHGFDPAIIDRLNRLVLEGNQILYGQRSFSPGVLLDFLVYRFPRSVRNNWKGIAAVHLLFYVPLLACFLLCVRNGEFAYAILGESRAREMENMYDPRNPYYLTPRAVTTDADMFGYYIYHNISISFEIFAGGIVAGIGSIVILFINALFLGAAAAHVVNAGFRSTFFPFVAGHSGFELTALVLSAFGGLYLGYRLFITKGLTRAASLKRAGKTAAPIIGGSALLLVLAAAVEAFWSPHYELPPAIKYGAGAAGWVLLFLYFAFSGRKHD